MIIFAITNKGNGMTYVGQTVRTVARRKAQILSAAKTNSPVACRRLNEAIREYGAEGFEWSTIETCATIEDMRSAKIRLVVEHDTLYPNGYNLMAGYKGNILAPETRMKKSESMTAVWTRPEFRAKQKTIQPARSAKLSVSTKRRFSDPAERINQSKQMKKFWTPVERAKQSKRLKKLLRDPAIRAKLSDHAKARPRNNRGKFAKAKP